MTPDSAQDLISRGFRLTRKQMDYLADGSYGFMTRSGKSVYRDLKVIAQEKQTGCVIVKEHYSGDYNYEKTFILSPEGRTEKLKVNYKSNPIVRNKLTFHHEKLS